MVDALSLLMDPLFIDIMVIFGIYLILSLSFNIEYGFTGIPNLGKVLFYAVGAYVAGGLAGWIALRLAAFTPQLPPEGPTYCAYGAPQTITEVFKTNPAFAIGVFLLSMMIGAALGAVLGVLASYPALRLREDFLAITLLAFSEIGRLITRTEWWPVCAHYGIRGIATPFAWLGEYSLTLYMFLVLGIAALMYLLAEKLVNSPWGRALKAVRDDELAAEVYGKNPARVRAQAMAVGSAMAAVAGVLYTFYARIVFPDDFIPIVTFLAIAMVMLGGTANNKGVVVGVAVLVLVDRLFNASVLERKFGIPLPDYLSNSIAYLKYVVIGLVIVLILMFGPQGLIPERPLKTPIVEETKKKLKETAEGGED